jgi:DNA-directed RNA polymerase subunit RPC12/RpoP
MAEAGEGKWIVELRCLQCGGRFTISRLSPERIPILPQVVACPYCSAQPVFDAARPHLKKVHRILDVRRDNKT